MSGIGSSKVFYGWYIVLAGFLIAFAGLGVINSMAGVLLVPICDDLGFSRGEFTFHRTILVLVGSCFMPLYGKLYQNIGVKNVLIASSIAVAIVTIAYSFSTNIWHFYILALANGIFISGPSFMTVGYLINNWFEDKRGFATGIAFAGSGFGAAVFIPIVSRISELTDWRDVYRFCGIVVLAILVPTILFLVKERPEDMGLKPYESKTKSSNTRKRIEDAKIELSFSQALRTPIFWMLIIAFFLLSIMAGGPNFNAVPYLTDIGYTAAFAAMVMSVLMLAHTLGNMTLGGFFDRFGMLTGSLFLGLCCIIFPILALNAGVPVFVWLFALFYGPASSGFVPVALFTTVYFGRKDFAAIFSIFNTAAMVGTALSGPSMAFIYDATGSYFWSWIMLVGFGLIITICLVCSYAFNRKKMAVR